MIVLVKTIGQRSNQIWQHMAFDSYCRENNLSFVNLELFSLQKKYSKLRKKILFYKYIAPIFAFVLKALNKFHLLKIYNLDKKEDLVAFVSKKKKSLLFVKGLNFGYSDLLIKYRELYNSIFIVACEKERKALLTDSNNEKTLGVHIRRGDYKEFEGGRYYYSDEDYSSVIDKTLILFPSIKDIVIFTNDDNLNKTFFNKKYKKICFSENCLEIDHALMGSCSYLVGPPSTFTMLASYLGEVPLCSIDSCSKEFKIEDFKIYNNL